MPAIAAASATVAAAPVCKCSLASQTFKKTSGSTAASTIYSFGFDICGPPCVSALRGHLSVTRV